VLLVSPSQTTLTANPCPLDTVVSDSGSTPPPFFHFLAAQMGNKGSIAHVTAGSNQPDLVQFESVPHPSTGGPLQYMNPLLRLMMRG